MIHLGFGAFETNLLISAPLPQAHFWVGKHVDPFMAALEKATGGSVTFTPFYAGELTSVRRDLDALQGGAANVAAPLLAPFHEVAFPLSDVTPLNTTARRKPRHFWR